VSVLRDRDFLRFFGAQAVSMFGERMVPVAVVVAVLAGVTGAGSGFAALAGVTGAGSGFAALAGVTGAGSGFAAPATTGLLPEVVPEQLAEANGLRATAFSAGE
jgi:MFS family permease